jgi:uncharacterized protein (DUF433 family)
LSPLLQIESSVCHGKPVFRETRILVSTILAALGGGDSIEVILEDYPGLTRGHLAAALEFGSRLSESRHSPVPASLTSRAWPT